MEGRAIKLKREGLSIGNHKRYETCRFCLKKGLKDFLDFGNVPLAGGFLKKQSDFAKEKLYPFAMSFCPHCGLVQGRVTVDKKILFEDYFYFSSAIGTLADHFKTYAAELGKILGEPKKKFVVEIGSNDGVFLKPLKKEGFRVLGVDPARNIVANLNQKDTPTLCAYFGEESANRIVKDYGQADLIVTSNSFAHIDDMHDVMRGVVKLLKGDGLLCVETQYIGKLLKEYQYDLMYHEHMSYYCLKSLNSLFAMYGMEIFDVRPLSIHASIMRYYVQFQDGGKLKKTKALAVLQAQEKKDKLDSLATYRTYGRDIAKTRKELLALLAKLKKQGKKIAGYGASGRATQIIAYCGLGTKQLDFVIDDAPAKQGAYMPGSHLPIVSSSVLMDETQRPDYCLLFAWSFAEEILKKQTEYLAAGGKFIVPLPKVKVMGKK